MHDPINQKPVIIFDLDGTLVRTDERWYALHAFFAKKYKQTPFERNAYLEAKKNKTSEEEIIQQFSNETIQPYLNDRIEHIEDEEYLEKDTVKPGVPELLKILSEQYRLVLLTKRKRKALLMKEVERLGLSAFFDRIYVSSNKNQTITEIIEAYGDKPKALIGDTEDDLHAASSHGIQCILVADGTRSRYILSELQPAHLFDTISEVQTVL